MNKIQMKKKRVSKNKKIKKRKEESKDVYQMSDRIYEHFN